MTPPGPPLIQGGGLRPPLKPPPAMRIYQACELFSKAPGVGVVIAGASGVVVVLEMQLGVTSKTMQVKVGYSLLTEVSLTNGKLAKSQ